MQYQCFWRILHINQSYNITVLFLSIVPTTTSRDMSLYLKSKYSQSLHVQQIHTKYDSYASFKITAPLNMKTALLNRKNWINDVYVREFKGKFQY